MHLANEDDDAESKGIFLGNMGVKGDVGHCCVTSLGFERLVEGEL